MANTLDSLFFEIAAFLSNQAEMTRSREGVRFWRDRTAVDRNEIDMLMALMDGPLCADALSRVLNGDLPATKLLLNAMVAIGMVETCGERYRASETTMLYCQALAQGTLDTSSADWA